MIMKVAVHIVRSAAVGAFVAGLALFSGCGEAPAPKGVNHGDLQIKLPGQDALQRTQDFDFGNVRAGSSSQVKLTLDNTGSDSIEITATRFENVPNGSFFALAPKTLAAGETGDLTLTFSPQEAGDYSGRLVLEHSGETLEATVNLSGHGQ
jgi:hypothetical protein